MNGEIPGGEKGSRRYIREREGRDRCEGMR